MYNVGHLIGGLMATFLVSRLIMRVFRSWNERYKKITIVHLLSFLIICLVAGMGMADGGAFAPLLAGSKYLIPQAIWFFYDIYLLKKSEKNSIGKG